MTTTRNGRKSKGGDRTGVQRRNSPTKNQTTKEKRTRTRERRRHIPDQGPRPRQVQRIRSVANLTADEIPLTIQFLNDLKEMDVTTPEGLATARERATALMRELEPNRPTDVFPELTTSIGSASRQVTLKLSKFRDIAEYEPKTYELTLPAAENFSKYVMFAYEILYFRSTRLYALLSQCNNKNKGQVRDIMAHFSINGAPSMMERDVPSRTIVETFGLLDKYDTFPKYKGWARKTEKQQFPLNIAQNLNVYQALSVIDEMENNVTDDCKTSRVSYSAGWGSKKLLPKEIYDLALPKATELFKQKEEQSHKDIRRGLDTAKKSYMVQAKFNERAASTAAARSDPSDNEDDAGDTAIDNTGAAALLENGGGSPDDGDRVDGSVNGLNGNDSSSDDDNDNINDNDNNDDDDNDNDGGGAGGLVGNDQNEDNYNQQILESSDGGNNYVPGWESSDGGGTGGLDEDSDDYEVNDKKHAIVSRGGDEDNASSEAPDDPEPSATDPENADPNVEAMDGATTVSIDGTDGRQRNRDQKAEDQVEEEKADDNSGDDDKKGDKGKNGYDAELESSYDEDEDDDDSLTGGNAVPNEETKEETAKSRPVSNDGSATETGSKSKDNGAEPNNGDETAASSMGSKEEENVGSAAEDASGNDGADDDSSAAEAEGDNNNAPGEETKHEEHGDIASKDTSLGTTAAGGMIEEFLGPGDGSTAPAEDLGLLENAPAPAPSPAPEPASGVVPTMIVADHGDGDDTTSVLTEPSALADEAKEEEDRGDTNENQLGTIQEHPGHATEDEGWPTDEN